MTGRQVDEARIDGRAAQPDRDQPEQCEAVGNGLEEMQRIPARAIPLPALIMASSLSRMAMKPHRARPSVIPR